MGTTPSQAPGELLALSNGIASAVERGGRWVVAVNGRPRTPSSGVHWQAGAIVTTNHTLKRDEEINITTRDDRTLPATLAGRDRGTDLAVLRVDAADLPPAEIGDASELKTGHLVLAIGRREAGHDGPSASLGLVSSAAGAWRTWRGGQIDRFLRLDLTVFLGFSGGALLDARGRVVGINTTGLWRGSGLAVPASTVDRVVKELLEKGHVPQGYIGLGMQPVPLPDELRSRFNLPGAGGMVVLTVEPDGPAGKAGALIGDVLVALDGKPVSAIDDLQALLGGERLGQTLRASVIRGGAPLELAIKVGERPRKSN